MEGDSDVDDEFKYEGVQASTKYGMKRKKKYLYNEAGVPFEPFNLENDIKDGIISNEGMMKISRENKEKESDESEDAWYETIKED